MYSITYIGPVIVALSVPNSISVSVGDTLNVSCRAFDCDLDSFAFEWLFDGVEVSGATIVSEDAVTHLTKVIQSESDLGNYTCHLINHGSTASVTVTRSCK